MDYKYIEQLLERYWQGETTLQEESILRSFFSQDELPESLRQYQPLFAASETECLGDDFDERILSLLPEADDNQQEQTRAKVVSLTSRLMPLFRAAAIVAIVLTLGNAAQAPWNYGWDDPKDEYAKFHQQQAADSATLLTPVQADIASDTTMVMQPESTNRIE